LAKAGYDVSLIVADGKGNESKDGVNIYDVGSSKGHADRMLNTTRRVFAKARELNAEVYHLHDPELLPLGLLLRATGIRVVYDMHENLPEQIRKKHWIHPLIRKPLAVIVSIFERLTLNHMTVIMAESSYAQNYSWVKKRQIVLNFPQVEEFINSENSTQSNKFLVGYIGEVTFDRGILMTIMALQALRADGLPVRFECIGDVATEVAADTIYRNGMQEGWIHSPGRLPPNKGWPIIAGCQLGVALLKPIGNYFNSYPTKMFEYMAMGLPVVVSNFPLYRDVIERHQCGFCVDPLSPKEIANAIDFLVSNPKRAKEMGRNGRMAVHENYHWGNEEEKLINLYRNISLKII
jgi:glycosyltransferase involved in cell wall biosynthesis